VAIYYGYGYTLWMECLGSRLHSQSQVISMTDEKKQPRATKASPSSLDSSSILEVPAGVFKNTCLALMDKVQAERVQVVVTKHGHPVARLVPVDVSAPSARGFMRGTVLAEDDIVSPDLDAWGDA
jgi:prevent-host-death family protein